jgi:hypothetical protein
MLLKDIHQSWQRFKMGLSIFVAGAVLLFTLSQYSTFLNYLSLAVLFVGFGLAMLGYIGIFLHRLSSINNKKTPPKF